MKILIVDDHSVVRKGLRQILAEEIPGSTFGEAGNASDALTALNQQDWDLVLLDLSLPQRDGFEVLADLKALKPTLPVLVLSMHPEGEFALRVLKGGASGYLTKQSAPEEMISAVRRVAEGGRYITASLAESLADELTGSGSTSPLSALSNREFQTLRLLAAGKSVKEIAVAFSISSKTVSTYRTRLLAKLNLQSTADLVRYALENDLVE